MKILYFAWLKQKTGLSSEEVAPPAEVTTVADLADWLAAKSAGHAQALANRDVVRGAVDQESGTTRSDSPACAYTPR